MKASQIYGHKNKKEKKVKPFKNIKFHSKTVELCRTNMFSQLDV